MNGLIGNTQSAKFIFIACDDEELIPSKSEMNIYFTNNQMNIYKSWGHFRESFNDIQNYIKVRQGGISSLEKYGNTHGSKSISHAIRMSLDCNRNPFFDLKYYGMIVDSLHLSHEALDKLSVLLRDIGDMNYGIKQVIGCNDHILQAKEIAQRLMLNDQKILVPNQNSIDDLFINYGNSARQQLMDRLEEWRQSVLWN